MPAVVGVVGVVGADISIEGVDLARPSASLATSAGSAGAECASFDVSASVVAAVFDQGILGAVLQPTKPVVITSATATVATIVLRMASLPVCSMLLLNGKILFTRLISHVGNLNLKDH